MAKIDELIQKALRLCELGQNYEEEDNWEKSKLIFEEFKYCIKEFDELNEPEWKEIRPSLMKLVNTAEKMYKKRRS